MHKYTKYTTNIHYKIIAETEERFGEWLPSVITAYQVSVPINWPSGQLEFYCNWICWMQLYVDLNVISFPYDFIKLQ